MGNGPQCILRQPVLTKTGNCAQAKCGRRANAPTSSRAGSGRTSPALRSCDLLHRGARLRRSLDRGVPRTGRDLPPDGRSRWVRYLRSSPATVGHRAADTRGMTSSVADVSEAGAPTECRTTEAPCLVRVTTSSLDDEQPKTGMVRWRIRSDIGPRIGTAVGFECPQGHSSEVDPELLKAFPSRRFW